MSSIYKRLPVEIKELVDAELSAHWRNVNKIDPKELFYKIWKRNIKEMDAKMDAMIARMVGGREAWKEYRKVRSQNNLTRFETSRKVLFIPKLTATRRGGVHPVLYTRSSSAYMSATYVRATLYRSVADAVREMKEERKIFHPAITPPREMRCGRRQIRREGVRGDARRRHGNRRVVKHGAWYGRGR